MAQPTKCILLVDTNKDFEQLREFCFKEEMEFVETTSAGFRGVLHHSMEQCAYVCQLNLLWLVGLGDGAG